MAADNSPTQTEQAIVAASQASSRGSHQLSAVLKCERLWALRYYQRLRKTTHKPWTLIGTLVHTCLAYHFAEMLPERPDWYSVRTRDEQLELEGAGHPDLIRQAKDCYEAWKQRHAGEAWHPMYVEEEFKAPLHAMFGDSCPEDVRDEVVSCKVDLVTRWNGQVWIVDHKCSSGDARTGRLRRWDGDADYRLALQVFQNLYILRACLDEPVRGFAIHRVKRSVPYDFDRHALQPPRIAYEQVQRTIIDAVRRERDITTRIERGEKPTPALGVACQTRYGPCDYHSICSADTIEDQQIAQAAEFIAIGGKKG